MSEAEAFQILQAKPATIADKSWVKWPRAPRFEAPKTSRAKVPRTHPVQPGIHVEIAVAAGLNLRKCSICGVEAQFGNFDVHHINGDNTDNRPENLTVLCRECHINIQNGYYAPEFPSDADGVYVEESDGVIQEY